MSGAWGAIGILAYEELREPDGWREILPRVRESTESIALWTVGGRAPRSWLEDEASLTLARMQPQRKDSGRKGGRWGLADRGGMGSRRAVWSLDSGQVPYSER